VTPTSAGSLSEILRRRAPRLARALRAHFPYGMRRRYFRRLARGRLTRREFDRLSAGGRDADLAARLVSRYHCTPLVDPPFVALIRRFRREFELLNFVETGTFEGETSLAMSLVFPRVFTCDIVDYGRRPEFYLRENIVYETAPSREFLARHLGAIRARSLFYLDAHWEKDWPLRDELSTVFRECERPVVILDDFDAGSGLECEECGGERLDFSYIRDLLPADYRFFLNPWSNRRKGFIFLLPGSFGYGCPVRDFASYREEKHGWWDRVIHEG